MNLAFREARPSGSPHPSTAPRDRECLRLAVDRARAAGAARVYLGGHSYGGRQSSMLAAELPDLVPALLLLSYPLHPPGQPERLRTAHFPNLRTASLFVHGVRDPFGSIEELQSAMTLIPARTSLLTIDGAGHELARKGVRKLEQVAGEIAARFAQFVTS